MVQATTPDDPIASDPSLDMFSEANGYRPFPEPSRYDRDWLARYREAQMARYRRLDAIAADRIAAYREERKLADPRHLDSATARWALLTRYMVIYRAMANPCYLDPTIHPNKRPMGTIFITGNPIRGNYGPGQLARLLTPRAWLSTWSGLSSQAELRETIREITIPTLLVYADGDCDIYPHEQEELLARSGAADKSLETVAWATHYLLPVPGAPPELPHPRARAAAIIVPWIERRLTALRDDARQVEPLSR